jgi:nicotinamidase-related amidase
MRFKTENTGAIIVDVQEKLFPHMENHITLLANLEILIQGLMALGVPLIVTQQYTKGLGNTIPEIAGKLGEYSPVEKITFSCWGEPGFVDAVQNSKRKNFIIAGIEAHVCIMQTAVDLSENGFTPVVIEDCISSRKINDKKIAIERMNKEGIFISTYESILFELCTIAGTSQFKTISYLVK